jgi:hypothetical protein
MATSITAGQFHFFDIAREFDIWQGSPLNQGVRSGCGLDFWTGDSRDQPAVSFLARQGRDAGCG